VKTTVTILRKLLNNETQVQVHQYGILLYYRPIKN